MTTDIPLKKRVMSSLQDFYSFSKRRFVTLLGTWLLLKVSIKTKTYSKKGFEIAVLKTIFK